MTLSHAHTLLYAMLCGSLFFVVTFMYQRNGSRYKLLPSLIAFAIAAITGAQWIEVTASVVLYSKWPEISPIATIFLSVLLFLAVQERGNVARILDRLTFVRTTKWL